MQLLPYPCHCKFFSSSCTISSTRYGFHNLSEECTFSWLQKHFRVNDWTVKLTGYWWVIGLIPGRDLCRMSLEHGFIVMKQLMMVLGNSFMCYILYINTPAPNVVKWLELLFNIMGIMSLLRFFSCFPQSLGQLMG
jgi:hypothetical protein